MKLLSLTITKVDSTSFYRANGVWGDLQRRMPNLNITSIDVKNLRDFNWSDLNLFDVIFMQRPYSGINMQMARFVKDMNLPLWIDYDDNLFEIPLENRAYDTFMEPKIREQLIEIARLADVITVSTAALKQVYDNLNSNVVVIPNALNTQFLAKRPQKTTNTVLWRGSDTHALDITMFAEPIYTAQEKYTDHEFIYYGYSAWMVPVTPNKKYFKSTDPILYFKHISQMAPKIMHVPLSDTHFNHCKSNIAYLEGTYAGAVCLVPDWPEWQLPGTVRYKDETDYLEKLELMLNNKQNFKRMNAEAWEYIEQNLTLKIVNFQREDILQTLAAKVGAV